MKGPISIEADNLRSTVRSLVENSHRACFLKDAREKKHQLFSFGTAQSPPPPRGNQKGEGWKYEKASSKPKEGAIPLTFFPEIDLRISQDFLPFFRSLFFPLNLSSPFRPLVPPPPLFPLSFSLLLFGFHC